MSKQRLYRYTCEECGIEIIAEKTPRGWLRLLSGERATGSRGSLPSHHGAPPVLWTPTESRSLAEDGHWCSPGCLVDFVRRQAQELVTDTPVRGTMRGARVAE